MPSLFTLINDDARLIEQELDRLEALGVPYEQAVEQAVQIVDNMTADKALSYAKVILSLEAFAESAKERAKAMTTRGAARQAAADRLRKRMLELLPIGFKAEDEEVKVRFGTSKRIDDSSVKDLTKLPAQVLKTVPERKELSKDTIRQLMKEGVILIEPEPPQEGKPKRWRLVMDGAPIEGVYQVEGLNVQIS